MADGVARDKVHGATERLRGCARSSSAMAGALESLESCLERHIPPGELAEVKRILYGGEARCATRTGSPPALRVSVPPLPGLRGDAQPGSEGKESV